MAYNVLINLLMGHRGLTTEEKHSYYYLCSLTESPYFVPYMIFRLGISDMHLPEVFFIYTILYVKSSSDLFQGLDKLDHMIKISAFQQFKDPAYALTQVSDTPGTSINEPVSDDEPDPPPPP